MVGHVQNASPEVCRARVDARRHSGLLSCHHAELREHTLGRCALKVRHGLRHAHPAAPLVPIPFERYLEQQNLNYPYPRLPISAPTEPVPMAPRSGQPAPHHVHPIWPEPTPALSHPDVPRLGNVTPVERTSTEVRLRVTYRVEVPLRQGQVIDLLA